MFTIRRYQKNDAEQVGILIAETYGAFNLPEMTPEKREAMLGPFAFARSSTLEHREAIAEAIEAPSVWVAEQDGEIVSRKYHRQGVGRSLVEQFEAEYVTQGVTVFKLSATLYAVPFYLSVGYKRSTGVRSMHSFDEGGLLYQPMKKVVM
jgi:GNAT superfamily N-acetyltransferase